MRAPFRRGSVVPLACLALVFAVGSRTAAQVKEDKRKEKPKAALDLAQPYLIVETIKGATLETEINEAAAAGYRVQAAWYGSENSALLKKMPGTPERVQYAVLDPFDAAELEKQLDDAGAQGFRLVPRTLMVSNMEFKNGKGRLRLLMERVPGTEARYEYFVGVATCDYKPKVSSREDPFRRGGTLQKDALDQEVQRAAVNGFTLAGMLTRTQVAQRRRGIFKEDVPQVEFTLIGEKPAQSAPSMPMSDHYRVLAGAPGAAWQTEINAATADGYQLALTSPSAEPILVLIFAKNSASSAAADQLIVGGSDTMTLHHQMALAAGRGYRVRPGFAFDNPSAVIMDRAPDTRVVHDYLVLDDLDKKEFVESTAKGWAPVGISRAGTMMIFEQATSRPIDPAVAASGPVFPASANDLKQLDTMRVGTMQKELNDAAAQGYRLMRAPFVEDWLIVTMAKSGSPGGYEYLVIAEKDDAKLEAALNDAVGKGFRVVPGTMATAMAMMGTQPVVLLEKAASGPPPAVRYRVIGATRLSTFNTELDKARQDGGDIVGIIGSLAKGVVGPHVAILERAAPK